MSLAQLKNKYSLFAVICTSIFFIIIVVLQKKWSHEQVIIWDTVYYYAYLPATFIEHDYRMRFVDKDLKNYEEKMRYWTTKLPNGNRITKTTMGVAYFYFPFFIIAHFLAQIFDYVPDGFSMPYHLCVQLSGLFFGILGLIFLRKFLLRFFDDFIIALTLLGIGVGTNIYYYATHEPSMSHIYSFCAISIFLYYYYNWINKPEIRTSIICGILAGIICLIRPINFVLVAPLFFIGINSKESFQEKLNFYWTNRIYFLFIIVGGIIAVLPQLLLWKSVTGNFIYYSYNEETFFFSNPYILGGLIGFRKGWFIYTPIMAIAMFGFYYVYKEMRDYFFVVIFIFFIYSYIAFSWWCWWYGGSFSSRPMVEFTPLMAIPLAYLIKNIFGNYKLTYKVSFVLLFNICIALNIFQTWQKSKAILHFDSMNWEAYQGIFLKTEFPANYDQLLQTPDYENALKGQPERIIKN